MNEGATEGATGRDRGAIRVIALAVIPSEDRTRHVVFRSSDRETGEFTRPLGGGVELGERAQDAVVREIREELGATFRVEALLAILENLFEHDGRTCHEIVFVYAGTLAEGDVLPLEGGWYAEDSGEPMWVEWRPVDPGPEEPVLYPVGLQEALTSWLTAG